MTIPSSFSQSNRKSKDFKARRLILFAALLGVVIWLSYQVKHSYDVKHEYGTTTESNDDVENLEVYLGRKFHPGDGSWGDHVGEDHFQLQKEGRDQIVLNEDGESQEVNESKLNSETQHVEMQKDVKLHFDNVNNESSESIDVEKLKPPELNPENEEEGTLNGNLIEQEYSSTTSQENGAIGKSDGVNELLNEDASEDQNKKSSEGSASQELGDSSEHANHDVKITVGTEQVEHTVDAAVKNTMGDFPISSKKQDDVSQEQIEIETGSDGNGKGESDTQEAQSEDSTNTDQSDEMGSNEARNSDSEHHADLVDVTATAGLEPIENATAVISMIEDSILDVNISNLAPPEDQKENSRPEDGDTSRKKDIESEGHGASTDDVINDKFSNSTELVKTQGSITEIPESKTDTRAETNLSMVTDNTLVDSLEDGVSKTKTAESIHSNGEDSG